LSTGKFAKEFLFIHAVLERLAAIDKDYGNLIVVFATQSGVRVDVDLPPLEAAAAMKLDEALLDDFAEMTSLAGIYDDVARLHGRRSVTGQIRLSKIRKQDTKTGYETGYER
jgi:hypothetical protein